MRGGCAWLPGVAVSLLSSGLNGLIAWDAQFRMRIQSPERKRRAERSRSFEQPEDHAEVRNRPERCAVAACDTCRLVARRLRSGL